MNEIIYTDTLSPELYNTLREKVGWARITNDQARRGLQHTTFLVAAQFDNETVGMGRILFDYGYTAYIGDIIVVPEFQGQGIGKTIVQTLMDKVIQAADPDDKIMFTLAAAKEKEKFYQKLGFEVRPSDHCGPGMMKWISARH